MKGIHKPVVEFVGWRWAPTVGLLSAALLYVGIVVALVPDEIGGPVPPSRPSLTPRTLPTHHNTESETTFSARTDDVAPQVVAHAPPPAPVTIQPAEFGRRGFSPPLERPTPPPEPVVVTPPPPPPPAVVPPPPPAPDPTLAMAQQPTVQRGLMGAAFNAARRMAGQMESNVNGNVAPAPEQPGAVPVPPSGAPVTPDGAPPAEAPANPAGEEPGAAPVPPAPAPPTPVQ